MASYTVHNRPGAGPEDAIFVAEGFSIAAFIFAIFWALWHRMWVVAAILLAIAAAISVGGSYFGLGNFLTATASFAVSLIFGFEAGHLRARSLAAAGYNEIGLSHGRNLDEAEMRFYGGMEAKPTPPLSRTAVQPLRNPVTPDTLSIFGNV
jgi:Protein of unknown function (DUF2628)